MTGLVLKYIQIKRKILKARPVVCLVFYLYLNYSFIMNKKLGFLDCCILGFEL